jgi:hypothetical protein
MSLSNFNCKFRHKSYRSITCLGFLNWFCLQFIAKCFN